MTYHERTLAGEAPLEERKETAKKHLAALFRITGHKVDGNVLDIDPDGAATEALAGYYPDVQVLTLPHAENTPPLAALADTVASHEVGGVFAMGTTLARAKRVLHILRENGFNGLFVFSVDESPYLPNPVPEFYRQLQTDVTYHIVDRIPFEADQRGGTYVYRVPVGELTSFDQQPTP